MSEQIASNRRILKNTIYLYTREILIIFISLYTSRLILDALGISDFGIYNVVGGILVFFTVINGALSSGTSRFLTYEIGKGDTVMLKRTFSAAFFIHLVVGFLILFLGETIGLWYINHVLVVPHGRLVATNWVYQFTVISCFLSMTQIPYSAIIIAHERMKIYAWVGIVETVWKLLVVLLLVYIQNVDKLIFWGAINGVWSIGLMIYYRLYCKKYFPESLLIMEDDKSLYKTLLSFSLWDLFGNLTVSCNGEGINLAINYYFGVAVNAARGVAYQVEGAIQRFTNGFMTAVTPQITKLCAVGDNKKMFHLVFESSKLGYFLLIILSLPVFFEADYILNLWLKKVPEGSVVFLQWVLINAWIRGCARPVITAVHATGNIKWLNLWSGGTSLILTLPLTMVAFNCGTSAVFSLQIMAGVSLVCNYLELICLRREIKFRIWEYTKSVYLIVLIITVLSSIPLFLITSYLPSNFGRLLLTCMVSTVCLFVLIWSIGIDAETRNKLLEMIKSKFCQFKSKKSTV